MVVDLISAASDGVIALLSAAIDDNTAEVTTNPDPIEPTDTTERQYVIMGDIDTEREGGKGDLCELITVQVVVVYRGRQRWKLHVLMNLVREALDGERPVITGVDFTTLNWTAARSSPAGQDGITHAGVIEFEVRAEPTN